MKMFPTNELRVAVDDVTKTKLQAEPTVALAAFHFAAKYFRQLADQRHPSQAVGHYRHLR